MDMLPAQALAVPSERVFSSSKETCTLRRNRVSLREALQVPKYSYRSERLSFVEDLIIVKEADYTISGQLTESELMKAGKEIRRNWGVDKKRARIIPFRLPVHCIYCIFLLCNLPYSALIYNLRRWIQIRISLATSLDGKISWKPPNSTRWMRFQLDISFRVDSSCPPHLDSPRLGDNTRWTWDQHEGNVLTEP